MRKKERQSVINELNILTENCSLQKNEHIDEDKREEKACEREVEYGKHPECFFVCLSKLL